jgi:hypothetical protein
MGGPNAAQQNATNTETSIANSNEALEQQLVNFGEQRIQSGDTLQQPLIQQLQALSSGNPQAVVSAAGPQLGQIAQSGQAASANIMNTIAPGAARDVALSQVPMQTYSQSAGLLNSLVNNAPTQLAQVGAAEQGLGTTQIGQGQGSGQLASTTSANIFQQQQSQQNAQKSEMGQIFGSLIGGAGEAASGGFASGGAFGCWIAEVIYGVDDWRTHTVRAWLNGPFRATWFGRAVMWLYLRFGRRVAVLVEKHMWLRSALTPLFDRALNNAMAEYECGCMNL